MSRRRAGLQPVPVVVADYSERVAVEQIGNLLNKETRKVDEPSGFLIRVVA
jgi:hypothetical protein